MAFILAIMLMLSSLPIDSIMAKDDSDKANTPSSVTSTEDGENSSKEVEDKSSQEKNEDKSSLSLEVEGKKVGEDDKEEISEEDDQVNQGDEDQKDEDLEPEQIESEGADLLNLSIKNVVTESQAMSSVTNSSYRSSYSDSKGGTVKVYKKDEKGDGLGGAVFNLRQISGGSYDLDKTTSYSSTKGLAVFSNLSLGTYILTEKSAPSGYEKSDKRWKIFVSKGGETTLERRDLVPRDVTHRIRGNISCQPWGSEHALDYSGGEWIKYGHEYYRIYYLKYKADLKIDGRVNPGDSFEVELNDEERLFNTYFRDNSTKEFYIYSDDGELAAKGIYNPRRHNIKYTFTEWVANKENIRFSFTINDFLEDDEVTRNGTTINTFMKVGNVKYSKYRTVRFDPARKASLDNTASVEAQFSNVNFKTRDFGLFVRVNPLIDKRGGCNPTLTINTNNYASMSSLEFEVYRFDSYGNEVDSRSIKAIKDKYTKIHEGSGYTLEKNYDGSVEIRFASDRHHVVLMNGTLSSYADSSVTMTATVRGCNRRSSAGVRCHLVNSSKSSSARGELVKYPPVSISAVNRKKSSTGKFKIKKVNESKEPLSDVVFTLYDSDDDVVERKSTNSSGIVEFSGIPTGSYEIRETKGPDGYENDGNYISLKVDEDGNVKYTKKSWEKWHKYDKDDNRNGIEVVNHPLLDIKLKKVDQSGKPLYGAKFKLYIQDDKTKKWIKDEVATDTSDRKGIVYFEGLKPNSLYKIVEVEAPEGYGAVDPDEYLLVDTVDYTAYRKSTVKKWTIYREDVELKNGIKVENIKKPSFSIKKTDEDSKYNYKGAEFTLYKLVDGKEKFVAKRITNDDGRLVFNEFDLSSTYKIVETKAPDGFRKSTNHITVKVNDKGKIRYTKESWNKWYDFTDDDFESGDKYYNYPLLEFKLKKVDSNSNPLKGAKFGLYKYMSDKEDYSDVADEIVTSGDDGIVHFTKLKSGELYRVAEIKAPDGYLPAPSDDVYYLDTVRYTAYKHKRTGEWIPYKEGVENVKGIEFVNHANPGFVIRKTDGSLKHSLEGAEFTMYELDSNGNKKGEGLTIKSGKNGRVEFNNLKKSTTYLIQESKAPDGSVKSDVEITVKLNGDGKISFKTNKSNKWEVFTPDMFKNGLDFVNKPILEFKFKKVKSNKDALSGAQFSLLEYDWDKKEYLEKPVELAESDEQGIVHFKKLKEDKSYKIVETRPPEGYAMAAEKDCFTVDTSEGRTSYKQGKTSGNWTHYVDDEEHLNTREVVNIPNANLSLKKFTTINGEKVYLKGAEFELYKSEQGDDGSYQLDEDALTTNNKARSNEDGLVEFKDLKNGLYWIKETKAPAGYIKSDKLLGPILVEGSKVYTVQLDDKGVIKPDTKNILSEKDAFFDFGEVENYKAQYPITGSVGIYYFFATGVALMILSSIAVPYIKKKRRM